MTKIAPFPKTLRIITDTNPPREVPWELDAEQIKLLSRGLWKVPAGEAPDGVAADWKASAGNIAALGRRFSGLIGGPDPLANPSKLAGILIAAAPEEIEQIAMMVERIALSHPEVPVICVDLAVPGWIVSDTTTMGEHHITQHYPGQPKNLGRFDEEHLVIIAGPRYDGFATCTLTSHRHAGPISLICDEKLAPFLRPQCAPIPIHRDQTRGIDLEIEPANLPRQGVTGYLHATDPFDIVIATMRVTMIGHPGVECSVSGSSDGPLPDPLLTAAVDRLLAGKRSPWRLVAAIDRAEQRDLATRLKGFRGVAARAYRPMLRVSDWLWRP